MKILVCLLILISALWLKRSRLRFHVHPELKEDLSLRVRLLQHGRELRKELAGLLRELSMSSDLLKFDSMLYFGLLA